MLKNMASLLDLPRELLLYILKLYLETESQRVLMHSIAKVDKVLGDLCLDSSLYESFDGSLPLKTLKVLLEKGSLKQTKSFILSKMDELSEKNAFSIFEQLLNVTSVDLSRLKKLKLSASGSKKANTQLLELIADKCPKLNALRLAKPEKFSNPTKILGYEALSPLLTFRGANLLSLDISYCQILNLPLVLRCIADSCPNLEELMLVSIHNNSAFPTRLMQVKCPKLKKLCLDYHVRPSKERHEEGFPNLVEFSFFDPGGSSMYDQEFLSLLFNSSKLSVVNISTCYVSTAAVCQIPSDSIEYLDLSKSKACVKDVENILEKWCQTLKVVNLSYCKSSSIDKAIFKLVSIPAESPLEVLNLSYTMIGPNAVKAVLEKCDRLRTLHLESCRNLNRGMKRVYIGASELDVLRKNINNLVDRFSEND